MKEWGIDMNNDYRELLDVLHGKTVTDEFVETMGFWINRHRIEKPVYNQMENRKSPNGIKIKNALDDIQKKRDGYIDFISMLNKKYSMSEPIFIKGVTAYLLTKDEDLLKQSLDIDLFGDNISALQQKLFSDGFEIISSVCDRHEFSKLYNKRRDIYVELHKYFPMLYLNENCVDTYTTLNTTEIEYSDLWKESKNIDWHGNKIRVLNPEMAVLISCAHVFKGYVWQPYEKNMFRVQELLEIYSIVNNTAFKAQKYIELCDEYNGWDASSFCKEVLAVIYKDKNPFSFIEKSFKPIFKLTNDIAGVFKAYYGENFFSKILTNCVFDFLQEETINTLSAGKYNIHQLNYIDCGKNKRKGDLDLSIAIREREIEFQFFVADSFSDGDNILIQLNKVHFHFHMSINNSKIFGNAKCNYYEVENGYLIHCVGISPEEINVNEEMGVIIYEHKGADSHQILIPINLGFCHNI